MSTGVDIVRVERVRRFVDYCEAHHERFLSRIFTEGEQEYCNRKSKYERYASVWAAKEAVMKALGVGARILGQRDGLAFTDIEVVFNNSIVPDVNLEERAKEIQEEMGIEKISLSLSTEREYAVAFALAEY